MSETLTAGQAWDVDGYRKHVGFVSTLGAEVLSWLDPQPGEVILDLGCGEGALTETLAASGATVHGLEPDPKFAAASRQRGLRVVEQDAHDPFGDNAFDAVFSNAALHWMRDPDQVFANVFDALRPGGRFVAEQGGFGNVAAVVTALNVAREKYGEPAVSPWYFPSVTMKEEKLRSAGFEVMRVGLFPRPTPLPTGMTGWLLTFGAPFLRGIPQRHHEALLNDAEARLGALHDPKEGWIADYVRLRFEVRKPAET